MEIKVGEIGKALRFPLVLSTGAALPLDNAASATITYQHMGTLATRALAFESPRSTGILYLVITSSDFILAGIYDLEIEINWNTGEKTKTQSPWTLTVTKALT